MAPPRAETAVRLPAPADFHARLLASPVGRLVTRPWFRSLQFAADVDNGYATMAFPTVNEAIRYADAATATKELADLVNRVDQARAALVEAAAALR